MEDKSELLSRILFDIIKKNPEVHIEYMANISCRESAKAVGANSSYDIEGKYARCAYDASVLAHSKFMN
jgi:hypothetical protein